jgi:hypothetical protein
MDKSKTVKAEFKMDRMVDECMAEKWQQAASLI